MIPEDCTLEGLHEVIQGLFDWDGSHLWSFTGKNDLRWELPSDSAFRLFGPAPKDPCKTCVGTVLAKKGSHLDYTYDFGDNWRHRITRMTDPKVGTAYGCVKTTGPDGIEDCGGPYGLADEKTHVPTVSEVNGRIPKTVKTGVYTPPVSADHPESAILRDIVASKDTDVLRQVAAQEEPPPSREECIERTVKLLEELVAHLLDVRSYSGYASYVVNGNELRWVDFNEEDDEELGTYSDFRRKRFDVPRHEMLTREEFLAYEDEAFVEDVEPVRSLLAFIGKKCDSRDSPVFIMGLIVRCLVSGDEPGEIVASCSKELFPDKEKYSEKLRRMIENVRDNIRLPIYNGHTYRELREKNGRK